MGSSIEAAQAGAIAVDNPLMTPSRRFDLRRVRRLRAAIRAGRFVVDAELVAARLLGAPRPSPYSGGPEDIGVWLRRVQ